MSNVYVVAEAGVNHNGELDLARRLVDCAAEAGADAVKFQTFRAERVASQLARKAEYQERTTDPAETQLAMLRRLELSAEAHRALLSHCRERRITFLSTPFDEDSADLLAELRVPMVKIASGELTNLPFLAHVAKKGIPMIVSTGMATLGEVEQALATIRGAGGREVALLHCLSDYPADPGQVNLRAMETMRRAFGVPVGFSDHTAGIEVALAAVALGAAIVEKHFTTDRNLPGPDHRASLEPSELAALVRGIRTVEMALGDGIKAPAPSEENTRVVARRSLAAAVDLPAGTVLAAEHLTALRPATGIAPGRRDELLGHRVNRAIAAGELIDWRDLGR